MKLVKTASGKKALKLSKSDWERIGKQAGWFDSDDDWDEDDWKIEDALENEEIMKKLNPYLEELKDYGEKVAVEQSPETKEWDLFFDGNLITTSYDLNDIFLRVKQIAKERGIEWLG